MKLWTNNTLPSFFTMSELDKGPVGAQAGRQTSAHNF